MASRIRRHAWPLFFAFALAVPAARADIYTWTDASGKVNVSNLSPPEGVRVTHITHEDPSKAPPRTDNARDAARDADVHALSDRVRQLEQDLEVARSYVPPPPVVYSAVRRPPPPIPAYTVDTMPPTSYGCDPAFAGCGFWPGAIYPPNIIVLRAPHFRRAAPFHPPQRAAFAARPHQPLFRRPAAMPLMVR